MTTPTHQCREHLVHLVLCVYPQRSRVRLERDAALQKCKAESAPCYDRNIWQRKTTNNTTHKAIRHPFDRCRIDHALHDIDVVPRHAIVLPRTRLDEIGNGSAVPRPVLCERVRGWEERFESLGMPISIELKCY
jgi:hypothetical protein